MRKYRFTYLAIRTFLKNKNICVSQLSAIICPISNLFVVKYVFQTVFFFALQATLKKKMPLSTVSLQAQFLNLDAHNYTKHSSRIISTQRPIKGLANLRLYK